VPMLCEKGINSTTTLGLMTQWNCVLILGLRCFGNMQKLAGKFVSA
jgi:small basic protein